MQPVFLISGLASKTGLSIHAINYYIKLGLIKEVTRDERSGYRLFDENTIRELNRIIDLRQRDISIREILDRKHNGIL